MDEFASTDNTQPMKLVDSVNAPVTEPGKKTSSKKVSKPLLLFTALILLLIVVLVIYTFVNNKGVNEGTEEVVPSIIEGEETNTFPTTIMETNTEITHGFRDYTPSDIAFANEGNVILFFAASWCPTCTKLEADIKNNLSSINNDLLILRVDYDSNPELKSKYGITYQHTLVQIDQNGEELSKWYGSVDLESLESKVI